MGYESSNPVLNLQSAIICIFVLIGKMIFVPLLARFHLLRWPPINKFLKSLEKSLYWNAGLRMAKEMYFELLLIAMIRLKTHEFDTNYEKTMTILAFCWSGFLAVFAIGTCLLLLYVIRGKTEDENVQARYGTLFEDLKANQDSSLMFTPLFLVGRILFVAVILLLQSQPYFQVTLVMLIALVQSLF